MIALRLGDRELDELAEQLAPRIAARLPKHDAAPATRYLSAADVAKLIGSPSRKALEMRLLRSRQRGEMHPLEKLAIEIDGQRRWRSDDVVAWAEAQRR